MATGTAEAFLAREDVQWTSPVEADGLYVPNDDWQPEGENDEADEDAAEPPAPTDVLAAMREARREMADGVRAWCFRQGEWPSELLDGVVQYMMLRSMLMAGGVGESPPPEAALAMAGIEEADLAELERAKNQVMRYRASFSDAETFAAALTGEPPGRREPGGDG